MSNSSYQSEDTWKSLHSSDVRSLEEKFTKMKIKSNETLSNASDSISELSSPVSSVKSRKSTSSKSSTKSSPKMTRKIRTPPVKKLSPHRKAELKGKLETAKLANVMKLVCPDSGYCFSVSSEYSHYLNRLFANFADFSALASLTEQPQQYHLVNRGASGFVNEIYFVDKPHDYYAATILKSSVVHQDNRKSDSLMYEGLVGLYYINELCKKYPCFLETYGIYRYSDPDLKQKMMGHEKNKITPELMKKGLSPIILGIKNRVINRDGKNVKLKNLYNSSVMEEMTTHTENISLLVQHVKQAQTFHHFIRNLTKLAVANQAYNDDNTTNTLVYYFNCGLMTNLFQVYSILSHISDEYTHNDLHDSNVLLYSLENKFVKMTYHYPNGKVVEFYTNQIAKVIDYGRNYVGTDALNSKCLYDSICKYEREKGNPAKVVSRKKQKKLPEFNINIDSIKNSSLDSSSKSSDKSVEKYLGGGTTAASSDTVYYKCKPDKYGPGIKNGDDEKCGVEHGFGSFWNRILDPYESPFISIQHRNKSADLLLLCKLAQSLFISPTNLLAHTNVINKYITISLKNFLHQVLCLYEDERIENTAEIRYYMVEEMRKIILAYPQINTNNYITIFTTRSDIEKYVFGSKKKVIKFIETNYPELHSKVVDFYNRIPSFMLPIYEAHDTVLQRLIDLENLRYMENNEKDAGEKNRLFFEIQKLQVELSNAMHEYHRLYLNSPLGGGMYGIREYPDKYKSWYGMDYISNVDNAAAQIKKYITTYANCEDKSLKYFMKNMYVSGYGHVSQYEYVGELHVYLDGSGRQTHFEGVERV